MSDFNSLMIELFGTSEEEQENTTARSLEGSKSDLHPTAEDWKDNKRIAPLDKFSRVFQIGTPLDLIQAEPMKTEGLKDLRRVKENEQTNIFSYRPEVLKNKLSDFLSKLNQAGASYTVSAGYSLADSRISITCEDLRQEGELMNELRNNPDIEALLILKAAIKDVDLADCIKERACIRWENGYSDSLFLAVLRNLRRTGETPSKDLQPVTKWRDELKQLGII